MPQAPEYLRDMFPDDGEAWAILDENFKMVRGIISSKLINYEPTEHEWHAIDYLILEWDYSYEYNEGVSDERRTQAAIN